MDLKEQGNELFKAGRFQDACVAYTDALRALERGAEGGAAPALPADEARAVRITLHSNRAACRLKLGLNAEAAADCDAALAEDGGNLKLLYRRAKANFALKKLEPAVHDVRRLLDLDPSNKAATDLMLELRAAAQEMNSTSSQTMEVIGAAGSASTDKERTSKLRSVLGTILDDAHLAASIVNRGACEQLWAMHKQAPLAIKVLSKLAEFELCWKPVLKAVDLNELAALVREGAAVGHDEDGAAADQAQAEEENPSLRFDGAAAALNLLWRLQQHEDELAKADPEFAGEVPTELVLDALVKGLTGEDDSLRRIAVEGTVRVCTDNTNRSRAFVENKGMDALMSLIARDFNRNEPMQQVSVVLGQVLPSLKDDDMIKNYAVQFCKPLIESDNVHDQIKGVAGLNAIFFANKDLGEALVKEENLLDHLLKIARFGSERAQTLTAEVFSHVANSEDGRNMLAGDATDILKLLATADAGTVRSAAAVTLAKLNAIDFNAESENGMLVLSSVTSLLSVKASKEEHAKGVEAVSFVITDSQVKMMFIKGQGLEVLRELIKLARENAKEVYGYGLSFVFENLTMSEDDKRREKLREMEVTEEQWEQFEKLTKSQTRKSGQRDPRENVDMRIKVFVEVEGISALRALVLNSTSERVWEAASRTLCNIASVQSVRPQMIAQGALRALYKLTTAGSDKCKKFAAHALAKIFVTTDPHVLKDEQLMDTIGPLVRQVRNCDEDLVVFECCMALTNIATVSYEAKQKMVNAKAIGAFEYAQYSDTMMVRRAATQAINNLIPTDEVIDWFCNPDKLKLWLLFSSAIEDDQPTACAGTGAMANLAADERFAEALSKQENGLSTIVELANSDDLDIAHRAVVCLLQLTDTWPEGNGAAALKEAKALEACKSVLKKFPDSAAAPAAQECVEILSK